MTRVLLTGFGPFDGATSNPSADAARLVARTWDRPEELVVRELPVSFARAGGLLTAALDDVRPDVVVCAGLAAGRRGLTVERVAVNVVDARIPDVDGVAPVDVPVVAGAPVGYLSTLPVKACVEAVRGVGLEASVSGTAGTYVCNAVFFMLLDHLRTRPGVRAGFVHVPSAPPAAGAPDPTVLAVERTAAGLTAVLHAALDVGPDVRVTGGTEH